MEYEVAEVFRFGTPTLLFEAPEGWSGSGTFAEPYEVGPGNERFIIPVGVQAARDGDSVGVRNVLVNSFFEILKRMVPE